MKKSGNSFFIIPKELCDEPKYGDLSAYAILLYGLLRDRNSLSTLNGWKDDNGEIYLFFSLEEISKKLHCKKDRAEKSVSELEKAGLVKKVRQGCNKPNKLYVVNILSDVGETEFRKSDLTLSGNPNNRLPEAGKTDRNNTEKNNTEINNTNQSIIEYDMMMDTIKENIKYENIKHKYDDGILDQLVDLITDTVCNSSPVIRISGSEYPKEVVKARFLKLNDYHIEYVIECLRMNTSKVHNIKAYLLATLYNAPNTVSSYYTAKPEKKRSSYDYGGYYGEPSYDLEAIMDRLDREDIVYKKRNT